MTRRRDRVRVPVTCCVCGETREVRPALVRGFDALACARHPSGEVDLPVPAGHHMSVTSGVAGFFTGYTVAKSAPSPSRAVHRAASILAAAQGRPAPEPPFEATDGDVDPRLLTAFTAALGPHGWEIADWQREGRDFVVKVYTDFGWAGFLDGRPAEIAAELADLRAQAQVCLGALRCPSCEVLLDPFSVDPRPCGCGSVAWRPQYWTTAWDSMRGAMAYLDGGADLEAMPELIRLTAGLAGGCEPAGEWIQYDDDLPGVVKAFQQLVPGAQWAVLHDRPVAVIGVGASVQHGPAAALRTAAEAIGFRLDATTGRDYGRGRTVLRFAAVEPVDGRDSWFACARAGDGFELVVGQPDWSPPFEESDEHWRALEETDDWWILRPDEDRRHGPWTVDRCPTDFTYGSSALAATRILSGGELSADVLRAAVAEAAMIIGESRAQLEHRYARLRSGTG